MDQKKALTFLLSVVLAPICVYAATQTTNLKLNKWVTGDTDYVSTQNSNQDIIEGALSDVATSTASTLTTLAAVGVSTAALKAELVTVGVDTSTISSDLVTTSSTFLSTFALIGISTASNAVISGSTETTMSGLQINITNTIPGVCVSESSVTVTTNGGSTMVYFSGAASVTGGGDDLFMSFLRDGAWTPGYTIGKLFVSPSNTSVFLSNSWMRRDASPSAASHNYCLSAWVGSGDTAQLESRRAFGVFEVR